MNNMKNEREEKERERKREKKRKRNEKKKLEGWYRYGETSRVNEV